MDTAGTGTGIISGVNISCTSTLPQVVGDPGLELGVISGNHLYRQKIYIDIYIDWMDGVRYR